MELDHKLCYCYGISKRKIVNFVRQTRPRRPSMISQCFEAGSGCGWCIPFLVKIHRQVLAGEPVGDDGLTPEEYEGMRRKYRASVEEGTTARNSYEAGCEVPEGATGEPGEPGEPPDNAPGEACVAPAPASTPEEPFDYTRYFSRARPEPEPETLEAPRRPRRLKKEEEGPAQEAMKP
jgi:bacterioferritin-associated ferredoxin